MKRKKTKQIAKVSDFADKLFRLNMIVSYKPNLSVVYGWLIQTVGFFFKVILLVSIALVGGAIASPNFISESGHTKRYLIIQGQI